MKKKILLILIILLLTGCKVDYRLTISKDLSIEESVNMTGTDSFFAIYNKSSRLNVINMMLDIPNVRDNFLNNQYEVKVIEDILPYVNVTKKYDSIKNYTENTIFYPQYFEKLNYTKKDNIIEITTDEFYPIEPDNPERYIIKDLTLSITSPYKVVKHNASKVDDKTNTYYWEIKEDTSEFSLLFSFDSSKEYNRYFKMFLILSICILLIMLVWIIEWVLNNKNNKKR